MRKAWLVVGLLAAWWWMRGDEAVHPHRLQAAVSTDGFVTLTDKRVGIYDRGANLRGKIDLAQDGDVRIAGARSGIVVGWKEGQKILLGRLENTGGVRDISTWGKKAVALCDGVASNAHRFGIGWLESDGTVWFVHGPVPRTALPATMKASWCAIASADQNIALVFREGKRLVMGFCSPRECSSFLVKVPIEPSETLLGFGCVDDACLFASRDKRGTTRLQRVDQRGRAIVKTLDDAGDSAVTVVGAGKRAFAIAYVGRDGTTMIRRVTVDGVLDKAWQYADLKATPALAWADGRLFVATRDGARAIDFAQ